MQAKCLAQRLAHSQHSGTEATVVTGGCGLVLAAEKTRPPGRRPRP